MISASSVRIIGGRSWIPVPQRWPPLGLALGLESPGIDRGQDIPGLDAVLDRGETDPARHHQIRADIDLAEKPWVCEAVTGILPGVARAETDP